MFMLDRLPDHIVKTFYIPHLLKLFFSIWRLTVIRLVLLMHSANSPKTSLWEWLHLQVKELCDTCFCLPVKMGVHREKPPDLLFTGGQVVFLCVLWFLPTFDEQFARYTWNILGMGCKTQLVTEQKIKKMGCGESAENGKYLLVRKGIYS